MLKMAHALLIGFIVRNQKGHFFHGRFGLDDKEVTTLRAGTGLAKELDRRLDACLTGRTTKGE